MTPVELVKVAATFRYYAQLCRAFADSNSKHVTDLLRQAERWEADARMVELDALIMERSKLLIADLERLIPSGK